MLKNTRVVGLPDAGRLANMVRSPGIDPRTWVSLAVVKSVTIDPEEGVFADVRLMPRRRLETCRVGQVYAGDGFGLYIPIEVDDEVLVEAPDGDPDHGLILTRRLHSPSHPPSSDLARNPNDVLLVVKPNSSLRIIASGSGNVVVEVRDQAKVLLGGPDASAACARVGDSVTLTGTLGIADLQNILDTRYQLRPSPPPLPLSVGATIGEVATGSDKVKVL